MRVKGKGRGINPIESFFSSILQEIENSTKKQISKNTLTVSIVLF
jgi:hypothetical protein